MSHWEGAGVGFSGTVVAVVGQMGSIALVLRGSSRLAGCSGGWRFWN
ncbi:hypothetical protein [Rhodoferax sp.]